MMPAPRTTDEVLRESVETLARHGGNQTAASDELDIARATLQARMRNAARRGIVGGPPIPAIAQPPDGFEIKQNAGAYDADGNLLRQWVQSKQAAGEVYDVPAGHTVKGESALVDPEGRILVKWIKTREGAGDNLIDALRTTFAEYEGAAPLIPAPNVSDEDTLTIYPVPDLHLGMHAWGKESGDDYDTKLAVSMAETRIASLIEQSSPSRRAVILGMGDLFHANDAKAVTPQSGNRLDVDGRWPKVYLAGAMLMTRIIDLAAQRHAEVEVVILPGNHDPEAAVSLTVALSMFYRATSRIEVWQEPTIAWFHRFGKCLLGATHGHTMKADRMAMMLATDRAQDWGETLHRHFFFGHVHHESATEVGPVRVESFASPAARDAWNASSGYRSGRALSAITFHREYGEIGRHRVNIITTKE